MYILSSTFTGWCSDGSGVIKIFAVVKTLLNLVRFLVPIGIIVWTIIELIKNVINPDEKDSKKKIGNRLIAAIIIFLIPTIINMVMNVVNVGLGSGNSYRYNISECWKKAKL